MKETAQFLYDKGQVTAISVDFMNGARKVITRSRYLAQTLMRSPMVRSINS